MLSIMKRKIRKKVVLIADDQIRLLRDVVTTLKESYIVLTPPSGERALELIAKGGLDFIILDGSMPPGLNGDQIARIVRQMYPTIPVILQSGDPTPYLRLRNIGVKVMDKFDFDSMVNYVREVLG